MNKILFLVFVLCSAQAARAQTFEPGYLVLSHGDTLRGEVENAFWSDPPTEVRFRATAAAAIVTHPARHLRSVGLQSGRLLRREVVPLDYGAQKELRNLPTGLLVQQRLDSVLADVLVEGTATLLEVKLHDVLHFLIRRETRPYLELSERRYLAMRDGVTKIVDGNNYHNQLALYFGDCPATAAVASKAAFTAADMVRVVQSYNQQCSGLQQAGQEWLLPEKTRGRIAVQVGPVLGARYDALRLHLQNSAGISPPLLDGVNVYGRPHAQAGVYFDIMMPGRRIGLHTALLYSPYGRITQVADATTNTQATVHMRGNVSTLYVGLRGFRSWAAYRLLAGTGIELHHYNDTEQIIYYTRNGTGAGYDYLYAGFAQSLLPYAEVGIQRNRLTLTLNVRRYGKEFISEGLDGYRGHNQYQGRTWSTALALAYRLNGNSAK